MLERVRGNPEHRLSSRASEGKKTDDRFWEKHKKIHILSLYPETTRLSQLNIFNLSLLQTKATLKTSPCNWGPHS